MPTIHERLATIEANQITQSRDIKEIKTNMKDFINSADKKFWTRLEAKVVSSMFTIALLSLTAWSAWKKR